MTITARVPTSSVWVSAATDEATAGRPRPDVVAVRVWGAIHETLDFQFTVRVGAEALDDPQLICTPLRSSTARLDGAGAELYRIQPVSLPTPPGWYIRTVPRSDRVFDAPDCLVPLDAPFGGLPSRLASGTQYHFWMDLPIPKGSFEGVYVGEIELRSRGRRVAALPIELTVKPIVLSDGAEIPMIAAIDHRALFRQHVLREGRPLELASDDWRDDPQRDELNGVLRFTLRTLKEHGLTPVLPRLKPPLRVTAQQDVLVDWRQFDEVAEPCLNGRMFADQTALAAWPVPVPERLFPWDEDAGRAAVQMRKRYLSAVAEHFRSKGWLEQAYLTVIASPFTSAIHGNMVSAWFAGVGDSVLLGGDGIGEDDIPADLRVVAAWFPQSMRPMGWSGGSAAPPARSVTWAPPGRFFDRREIAHRRAAGDGAWLVAGDPPFTGTTSVFGAEVDARVLSWQAEREGASAIVLGDINTWPSERDARPSDCVGHDPRVLLYPGGAFGLRHPVESVRLKRLRRSQQDAAYRRALSDRGLTHIRGAMTEALAPYAGTSAIRSHFADGKPVGWPSDDAWFELAREIMAEELVRLGASAAEGGDSPFSRTAAWRRFMLALRSLRMWADGCRVREGERDDASVECFVTIQNTSRSPFGGQLRMVRDVEGGATEVSRVSVNDLPPDAARTVSCLVPWSGGAANGGIEDFTWDLSSPDGSRLRTGARVAAVTAGFGRGAPRIDGDLADWAPIAGGEASGFRSIVPSSVDGTNMADRVAANSTTAFFRRDANFLYVAVIGSGVGAGEPASAGNSVNYDDLVPVGEELIEVLLDPLNAGTHSPSDLFHVVVKPSGALLTEKGIRFDPPCGERVPWNADVVAATRRSVGRWTAELRIPFSAFGPAVHDSRVWGMNVTRFDAEHQEFSTWSGAIGNAYDPISLGNLFVPAGPDG